MDKGKAPAAAVPAADPLAAAPWVEKYRPKSLDDVAAHGEIIDTSEWRKRRRGGGGGGGEKGPWPPRPPMPG